MHRTALRLALTALLAVSLVPAEARDERMGVELIPNNYPNSTLDDVVRSLGLTTYLGGHSSKLWHWNEPDFLAILEIIVPIMHQFGLASVVQISPTFLGNPAPPDGLSESFGNAQVRARYLNDVEAIARLAPDYLVLATEINLMYRFNRIEFDQYTSLYAAAYSRAKSVSPNTKVGASYHHLLWYAQRFLDGEDVPQLLKPFDFVAFTAYPESLIKDGFFQSIDDIPASWFGTTRAAYPNSIVLFSETGWDSIGDDGPATQEQFVRQLPRLMSDARPAVVIWSLLQDVSFFQRSLLSAEDIAFLESLGLDIDLLFSKFNGMGLIDGRGVAKPGWDAALELEFPW